MNHKRVLVDVDEVLCDFHTPAIAFIRGRFGLGLDLSQLGHWDIFLAMTSEQRREFDEHFFTEGRCASLEMFPGAKEAIESLREHAEVVAVTRPPRNSRHWVHERTEYLISRLGFDHDTIIHTKAKHMITGDALIDDSPENVVKWQTHNPRGLGLLWALPNTEYLTQYDSFRVRNWSEVLERVKAL